MKNGSTISFVLRLVATFCFLLAMFGVSPSGWGMVPLGLALWCGSTLIP